MVPSPHPKQPYLPHLPSHSPLLALGQPRRRRRHIHEIVMSGRARASEDLWQEVINGVLKGVLGWGTEIEDDVIRRGDGGLGGLVRFVDYFVTERGVPEALFEGKHTHRQASHTCRRQPFHLANPDYPSRLRHAKFHPTHSVARMFRCSRQHPTL